MRKIVAYFIVLFCFVFNNNLYGQDFKKDLENMYGYYSVADNFSMQFDIIAYKNKNTKVVEKRALLKKQGEKFWYKIDETEMIVTQDAMVMVNHGKRDITVRAIGKKEWKKLFSASYASGMDSIIQGYDSIHYALEKGLKKYTIYTSKKIISKTELFLSQDSKLVKLNYWYNQKEYKQLSTVEINFLYEPIKQSDAELFVQKRIVIKEGTVFRTSQKFSSYNIKIVDL